MLIELSLEEIENICNDIGGCEYEGRRSTSSKTWEKLERLARENGSQTYLIPNALLQELLEDEKKFQK